jgi:hypothetical protein
MAADTHNNRAGRPLSDTSPEAERVLIELYRRMPAWQKLRQVVALNRMLRNLALDDIRCRHPHADAQELKLRLASRWLSAEMMRRVYGWDPDQEGY